MDFEPIVKDNGEPSRENKLASVRSFLDTFEVATHKKVLFYSNPDHIKRLSPIPDWLLEHYLWIANYGVDKPLIKPWTKWAMWQFTEAGSIDGIEDAVDLDHAQDDFVGHVTQPEKTDKEKLDELWKWYTTFK